MAIAQQIVDMAAAGKTAREIARALNVSRQRIYQVADAHGLTLPSGRHPLDGRRPPPPKARIVTGGIVQPISHSTAGTIAELLAAADLMARGWQVFFPLVRSTGHDLIGCRGAELVTVEVRSAIRNAAGAIVFNKKTTSKSDHHAYVVTGEIVTYKPELPL